jgi:membrane protein
LPRVAPATALRNLRRVLTSRDTLRLLAFKMRGDRILMRASALSFETLLAIVPLTAVAMAALRLLAGPEQQRELLHYLANRYVPAATTAAVNRLLPLMERLDLRTTGLVGLLALLPVMFSLVDAVELALSDIFRAPRRNHWWRLLTLGALVTLAPFGSLLTIRYIPWTSMAADQVIAPLLGTTVLLYVAFMMLPSVQIRHRAALVGSFTTGVALSSAKAIFGFYASHLGSSVQALWGATVFVPLLMFWILLGWCIVLLGAEVSATLQERLLTLELFVPHRNRRRPRRSRLRRRLARKPPPETHPESP